MEKIPVAILGATGTVGQKFIYLLENHPTFEIIELVASPRSAGNRYVDACNWKQDSPVNEKIGNLVVKTIDDRLESKILFSGMDASIAGEAETNYANLGHIVISNSKNHRMDKDVPLIIPEVNPDHFDLVKSQPYKGGIITNSNCSSMFIAMVLAPLYKKLGIEWVQVSTMQAISGAGYPGVSAMDILGNIVPFIGGEEDKVETESQKILGKLVNNQIEDAEFVISAHCNRVPVFDGHTENLTIKFKKETTVEEVKDILSNFKGIPQEKNLPFAPKNPIKVFEENDRPQPARDALFDKGMVTSVGRIRVDSIGDIKMTIMGHNTIRGAAGAAILNAETYVALGYLD
ncbi:aspartate-semialdehyde dehydrogenase [Thiospirochaeta perfilievii]|uniref:aspartate-semialdehyde dehydrogenase n=1 Tax=Thiospirochaeta perfilievii TaxID=252967 RepID=A0A5C1Q8C7_9SPIO|nr:aspartate-semialdehyde dehydrogenase [Thiospirochaeta perfilievii]QEN03219.1 aspartate-semialdehyde dehydrogenase [Thiospirochaeta perfilievii]